MKTLLHILCVLSLCFVSLTTAAVAQEATSELKADREKAFAFVEQSNFKEALPLLEKVHAANQEDTQAMTYLALCLVASAGTNSDQAKALAQLKRARQLAEKAQKLGDNNDLVQALLSRLPFDGDLKANKSEPRTPAGQAMIDGEAGFTSGNMQKALEGYSRAEKLDPKLYEAPLYQGDVYFQMKKIDEAGQAYARAIAIDPDRDTAYRFWGNVLMTNGKMSEAREKLIEAAIAQPYNNAPWQFLSRWAKAKNVELGHPKVETGGDTALDDKGKTTITLNADSLKQLAQNDGSSLWLVYHGLRASWMNEKFAKAYPNEKKYRHSLAEELESFQAMATLVEAQLKEGKLKEKDLDVSIANLLKLQRAGLLEPFILFAKADQGIAQDYVAYRKANRAKLRQYLMEFVVPNN